MTTHSRGMLSDMLLLALASSTQPLLVQERFTIVYVNTPCVVLFGYATQEEMYGMDGRALVAPEDRERITQYAHDRMAGRETPAVYRTTALRKDGTRFAISVLAMLIPGVRESDMPQYIVAVFDALFPDALVNVTESTAHGLRRQREVSIEQAVAPQLVELSKLRLEITHIEENVADLKRVLRERDEREEERHKERRNRVWSIVTIVLGAMTTLFLGWWRGKN